MSSQPYYFGRYVVMDRLSEEGGVELLRARLPSPGGGADRMVVLKRLPAELAQDESFVRMFEQEVKATLSLMHPNIIQLYDFGKVNNQYFIAMEYLPGKSLQEVNRKLAGHGLKLSPELAAHVITQVAQALAHAHAFVDPLSGQSSVIIHRDVHPGTIMISYFGAVKLCDFSLSKADGAGGLTQIGIMRGNPAYFAPERVADEADQSPQSDIFSLGVVFWELLTGRRLFTGSTQGAIMSEVAKADIPPPSRLSRDVPSALDAIALKALARDRKQRYQSAADLVRDLQRAALAAPASLSVQDIARYVQQLFREEISADQIEVKRLLQIEPAAGDRAERTIASNLALESDDAKTGQFISSQAYSRHEMKKIVAQSAEEGTDFAIESAGEGETAVPTRERPSVSLVVRLENPPERDEADLAGPRYAAVANDVWQPPMRSGASVAQLEKELVHQASVSHASSNAKRFVLLGVGVVLVVVFYAFGDSIGQAWRSLFTPPQEKAQKAAQLEASQSAAASAGAAATAFKAVVEFTGDTEGYEIEIDGRWVPVVNHRLEVQPQRKIQMRARKSGFEDIQQIIYVNPARDPKRVNLQFVRERRKGFLNVITVPTASLAIYEGEALIFEGQTPLEGKELPAGEYRLVLENSLIGYQGEVAVKIEEWKTSSINQELPQR